MHYYPDAWDGITPPKLLLTCIWRALNNVNHALSCAKGGFVIIRLNGNEVRDVTSELLLSIALCVTKDVETQPITLQPLTGERFKKKSANTGDGEMKQD